MSSTKYIAFTSAFGGIGTTSLALVFARTVSRMYGKKVMLVSLDMLSGKGIPLGNFSLSLLYDFFQNPSDDTITAKMRKAISEDEYGVLYLSSNEILNPFYGDKISLSDMYSFVSELCDFLIIDIPANCVYLNNLSLCEDIVLNCGFFEKNFKLSEGYYLYLKERFKESNIHKFINCNDEFSFENGDVDIHGELGARVRQLVSDIRI